MASVCFSYYYYFFFLGGGIDFRSYAAGVPPRCHQCHLAKNEIWAREVCFAKLGSMECLLERSYHVQTHTPAAVDPH